MSAKPAQLGLVLNQSCKSCQLTNISKISEKNIINLALLSHTDKNLSLILAFHKVHSFFSFSCFLATVTLTHNDISITVVGGGTTTTITFLLVLFPPLTPGYNNTTSFFVTNRTTTSDLSNILNFHQFQLSRYVCSHFMC